MTQKPLRPRRSLGFVMREDLFDIGECVYCGMLAQVKDHVLPYSFAEALDAAGREKYSHLFELVPACTECNGIASAKVFDSLDAKREFIHERLRAKHRVILDIPPWSEKDLDHLGPTLRQLVEADLRKQQVIRARLNFSGYGSQEAF